MSAAGSASEEITTNDDFIIQNLHIYEQFTTFSILGWITLRCIPRSMSVSIDIASSLR
jgi:hypothetical protein